MLRNIIIARSGVRLEVWGTVMEVIVPISLLQFLIVISNYSKREFFMVAFNMEIIYIYSLITSYHYIICNIIFLKKLYTLCCFVCALIFLILNSLIWSYTFDIFWWKDFSYGTGNLLCSIKDFIFFPWCEYSIFCLRIFFLGKVIFF